MIALLVASFLAMQTGEPPPFSENALVAVLAGHAPRASRTEAIGGAIEPLR